MAPGNDLFVLGMKEANLHSETDEDWYYIDLKKGEEYFVDLRNIGRSNWFIELYYLYDVPVNGSNGYYYTTNSPEYLGAAERYFYFIAQNTGRFYIRIAQEGDWSASAMNYFFYVGPAVQQYSIVDMPLRTSTQIIGSTYSSPAVVFFDQVLPKENVMVNMSLSNTFSNGSGCRELDKRVVIGSAICTNTSGTGSTTINGVANVQMNYMTFSGRCAGAGHVGQWSPSLSGSFLCIMAPYPGNEL